MRQFNSFDEKIRQINVLLVALSSDHIENIKTALKELGWNFRLVSAKEEDTIIQQLLNGEYGLFFINSEYLKHHPKVEKTLFYLPMKKRREQLFILLDEHIKSLDNFSAFKKSVNAVVNTKDLPYLSKLLFQIIDSNKTLYRGFQKMIEELEIF